MSTTSEIEHLRNDYNGKFPTYSMVGCYPIFYMTQDDAVLCPACVNGENGSEVGNPECDDDPQWTVIVGDANWEDPNMYCAHCEKRIESAYADDDSE